MPSGRVLGSGKDKPDVLIHELKAEESFILSEDPRNGVKVRDNVGDGNDVANPSRLTASQFVSLAFNEAGRKFGVGKLYWIPSRGTRSHYEGMGRDGADLVYVPWVWGEADNHIYDEASHYDRMCLTDAWQRLIPTAVVLPIFLHYKAGPGERTQLPSTTAGTTKFKWGSVSVCLLWDDFPNLAWREQFPTNLDAHTPRISPTDRRRYKVRTCEKVMEKLEQMWSKPYYGTSSSAKCVTMEEVTIDAFVPGPMKDQALVNVAMKSARLTNELKKAGLI